MSTPSQKRPRETPSTVGTRPNGRVVLDVGGSRFVSSASTLQGASSYFAALLTRWDASNDNEPLFIDADVDAFQPLLSYMRLGTVKLAQQDEDLSVRILLLAEYLGMDALLSHVKAKAYANMHPQRKEDAASRSDAFDAEVGTLQEAIDKGVLPARYFAPAPAAQPTPPGRKILTIIPAAPGYRAMFTDQAFDHGGARYIAARDVTAYHELLEVISFAIVEYPDGSQAIDAIVQRDLESTRRAACIRSDQAHPQTHSHLQLASEYRGCRALTTSSHTHWMLLPPRAPGQVLPIPAGSVRGVWSEPAFTSGDQGKQITIIGNTIKVGDETRLVDWGKDDPPSGILNDTIVDFSENSATPMGSIELESGEVVPIPTIASSNKLADLAFVAVDSDCGHSLHSRFYTPVSTWDEDKDELVTVLEDARNVTFGPARFSHFVGNCV